jgi:F-type H+-transporting ATPase subunit delta
LVQKGREAHLQAIVTACAEMIRKQKNIQSAEVITAVPMDDETRAQVKATLSNLHDGALELKETQDQSIIGGFVLRVDDRMIDASVRRQLQTVRRRLTEHHYDPEV